MRRANIELPNELWEQLDKLKEKDTLNNTYSRVIRKALEQFFKAEDKK